MLLTYATFLKIIQFMQLSIPNTRVEQSSGEWRNRHQEQVWTSLFAFNVLWTISPIELFVLTVAFTTYFHVVGL